MQWGGPRLGADSRRNTPDGKAHFAVPHWPPREIPRGRCYVTTRRGNQFNSMGWGDHDPLTGSDRDDVTVSVEDARRLALRQGARVLLRSGVGEFRGKVRIADIAPGNLAVHWPEANPLIRTGYYDPSCGEPDYNATCGLVALAPGAAPRGSALASGAS